jgi:hypothetical protein
MWRKDGQSEGMQSNHLDSYQGRYIKTGIIRYYSQQYSLALRFPIKKLMFMYNSLE